MADGHTFTTTPTAALLAQSGNSRALILNTRSEAGRAFMAYVLLQGRVARGMEGELARVRHAIESYRRTQANQHTGYRGYFIDVAEARAFVRSAIAQARLRKADLLAGRA